MATKHQEQQLSPPRREAYLASIEAGLALTAQQLDELWTAYRADRSDLGLRNRLVEHYLPFVRAWPYRSARKCASATRGTRWAKCFPRWSNHRAGLQRPQQLRELGPPLHQAKTDRPAARAERNTRAIFAGVPTEPPESTCCPAGGSAAAT